MSTSVHTSDASVQAERRAGAFTCCGREIRVQGRIVTIARLDGDKYLFLDDPEALLNGLQQYRPRIDLFTFLQRLPERSPRYSYWLEWDNLAAIPISSFDHWWTRQVNDKTRNMVRKAEKKGVHVREVSLDESLLEGIRAVYNECPYRQGKRFLHYGKDLSAIRRDTATYPDRSIFLGAFIEHELIGFAKLTWDETQTQAALMNIVSMVRHRDKAPTNALIAHAVRSCSQRHFNFLVYESFPPTTKRQDFLSEFKRHNGFLRFDLPRYYVPLTRVGAVALRLGLHKRINDYCPEIVLAQLRELRSAWYERKMHRTAGK